MYDAISELKSQANMPLSQLVDFHLIDTDPTQDRTLIDFTTLVGSMKARISAGKVPNTKPLELLVLPNGRYKINDGERRYRTMEHLKYEGKVFSLLYTNIDEKEKKDLMFLANFGQKELNLIDLADALHMRISVDKINTREEMCEWLSIDQGKLSRIISLHCAPDDVREFAFLELKKNPKWFVDLALLEEEERAQQINAVKNKMYDDAEFTSLVKDRKKEIKDLKNLDTDQQPAMKRKSTKTTVHTSISRELVADCPPLKKVMKGLDKKFKTLNDGDFNTLFQQALGLYIEAKDAVTMDDPQSSEQEDEECEQ